MTDLQTFREETRNWLEANCPQEMRKRSVREAQNIQFDLPRGVRLSLYFRLFAMGAPGPKSIQKLFVLAILAAERG